MIAFIFFHYVFIQENNKIRLNRNIYCYLGMSLLKYIYLGEAGLNETKIHSNLENLM